MMHTTIGWIGHELVIFSFVAALLSAVFYWNASRSDAQPSWQRLGRIAFLLHGLSVFGVVAALFGIIYNHYYEYHYAWSHSSNNLPSEYMISCFWEGQEGSFLLWIFWQVLLGFILIRTGKQWESSVMAIFALVQAFLLSMILGVVPIHIGDFVLKIGSNPFILLRDALDDPFMKANPTFIPPDGTGLNPLLQNYWMVIHPPTLFLGFALTLVPFAFCLAGLQHGKYKEWIKPALLWTLVGALVLGIGIMMGAYWAYETLNFGGYWNWDPVENAVYVPWLTMVASIHLMIIYQRKGVALKGAMLMVVTSFILILYSTFLTRSGILGEASVHSFTDLGLSGQLLIYLLAFTGIAIALFWYRWKQIPEVPQSQSLYGPETWVIVGVATLCLSGFQVIIPTSMPVFNAILNAVGIESKLAPPADQVIFYTKWQLWFGVGIAMLSATAQFFWWKKIEEKKSALEVFSLPLTLTFALTALIIKLWGMKEVSLMVLLLAGMYSMVSNGWVLLRTIRTAPKLMGGSLTHIGIALMLIGILFSAGYSKVISLNTSGLLYNKSFSEDMNNRNWLLFRNQPQRVRETAADNSLVSDKVPGYLDPALLLSTEVPGRMIAKADISKDGNVYARKGDTLQVMAPYYQVAYRGPRMTSEEVPGFVNKEALLPTPNPYKMVAKEDLVLGGKTYKKKGDSLQVYNENTYFEVEYRNADGKVYMLYPRIQDNPQMGLVPSPDISTFWDKDIYIHVTNIPDPEKEVKWSEAEEHLQHVGDTFFVNDYVAIFDGLTPVREVPGVQMGSEDVAVQANIRVLGEWQNYDVKPIFIIKDKMPGTIPASLPDIGLRMGFVKVDPVKNEFTFSTQTTQKDWIIVNALEKPFIGLLWLGTILMGLGMSVAVVRRSRE